MMNEITVASLGTVPNVCRATLRYDQQRRRHQEIYSNACIHAVKLQSTDARLQTFLRILTAGGWSDPTRNISMNISRRSLMAGTIAVPATAAVNLWAQPGKPELAAPEVRIDVAEDKRVFM